MKSLASLSLLALGITGVVAEPIRSLFLDDRVVVTVPVATNRVTTLSFPGPVAAIDAAGVTTDPKVPGDFQLAHTRGTSFLSVRAVARGARGNLNIRWDQRTWVFELQESDQPVLALNLRDPATDASVPAVAPRLSGTRLLALLDKAQAYPILKDQHPGSVAGVECRTFPGITNVTDFGDFDIRLDEVFRFNPEDTLVFHVRVRNRSSQPLHYRPDSFMVRAGDRLYPQSISDASGSVPPTNEVGVAFAVTGTPDGGRNELSLRNEFAILVTRTSPSPARP